MPIKPAWLTLGAGTLAGVATLLGFADGLWWRLDTFAHFRVQYLTALIVVAIVAAVLRRWRQIAVFAPLAAANLAVILPLYIGGVAPAPPGATSIRIAVLNVHRANARHDLVGAFLEKSAADFVLLEELDEGWLRALDDLKTVYPFRVSTERADNFGIAFLSKRPLLDSQVIYLGLAQVPSVFAVVDVAGKRLSLLGTHPLPPGPKEYVLMRNEQLERVAEFARSLTGSLVVCGDLNMTPWCYRFRKLIADSGLVDSERGRGFANTWPTTLPPLRIPIDHCLHSPDMTVTARFRGPAVGSDHFPLIVDLTFPK